MILEVVYITWMDSQASNTWEKISEIEKKFDTIHSVGFLVHQDEEMYLLAVSVDPGSELVNAYMQIPAKCVLKVKPMGVLKLDGKG